MPLGVNGIKCLLDKHTRRLHLKKRCPCHLRRHSCAIHRLKNNANLRHGQEILGHRQQASTERCPRLPITDLERPTGSFPLNKQQQRRKSAQG